MITASTSAASPTDLSRGDGTKDMKNGYTNTTTISDKDEDDNDDDKLLYRCFRHQGCGRCLDEENCSWCPFVCVVCFSSRFDSLLGYHNCPVCFVLYVVLVSYHRSPLRSIYVLPAAWETKFYGGWGPVVSTPTLNRNPSPCCVNTSILACSNRILTQSCIPNKSPIPLLAPAFNENICPHWTERWEIRTRPLGCQVSTITALTGIISIFSTLLYVGLVFLVVWAVRWVRYGKFDSDLWVLRPARKVWGGLRRGVERFSVTLGLKGRHGESDSTDGTGGGGYREVEENARLPVAEADGVNVGEREPLLRR